MSQATPLTYAQRSDNYAYQDRVTHKFKEINCPTYYSPRQLKRRQKKENQANKLRMLKFPF